MQNDFDENRFAPGDTPLFSFHQRNAPPVVWVKRLEQTIANDT